MCLQDASVAERLANPATKQELVNEVQKKYQKLLESPLPSAKTAKLRKSAKATSVSPTKQTVDVENDRPDRTPSPITSVIMAARADAERRKSRDVADLVRFYNFLSLLSFNNVFADWFFPCLIMIQIGFTRIISLKSVRIRQRIAIILLFAGSRERCAQPDTRSTYHSSP